MTLTTEPALTKPAVLLDEGLDRTTVADLIQRDIAGELIR
jgi:L-asparaginase